MSLNFSSIRSLSSLVNMFAGSDPTKAEIIPLDDNGAEIRDQARYFQYFPENIQDSKGVNYASKNIPGGSHPLYQFINGADRTISFTAIFTSDENPAPAEVLSALERGVQSAQSFLSQSVSPSNRGSKHTVPVNSAVIWLRSFMYPRFTNLSNTEKFSAPKAPRVCRIYLPNSGIHGSTDAGQLAVDSINCIMTQCDVVYESFYRNGTQRITTVNLTFNETIQTGSSNWKFSDGASFDRAWIQGSSIKGASVEPYNLVGTGSKTDVDNTKQSIADAINRASKSVSNLIG